MCYCCFCGQTPGDMTAETQGLSGLQKEQARVLSTEASFCGHISCDMSYFCIHVNLPTFGLFQVNPE